jgi:hypothetical protein
VLEKFVSVPDPVVWYATDVAYAILALLLLFGSVFRNVLNLILPEPDRICNKTIVLVVYTTGLEKLRVGYRVADAFNTKLEDEISVA